MPSRLIHALALSAAAALLASNAAASSGDAWETFRAEVSERCLAAASSLEKASAVVDPFGSESFGLALVIGTPKGFRHGCDPDLRLRQAEEDGRDRRRTGAR
ncbi:hypothetical protein BHMPCIPO_01200 [Ensifer sesbaniae]|nr:hypothetical protein [Ensifer sesbaniae]